MIGKEHTLLNLNDKCNCQNYELLSSVHIIVNNMLDHFWSVINYFNLSKCL